MASGRPLVLCGLLIGSKSWHLLQTTVPGRDTESGRPQDRGSNHTYDVTTSQQPSSSTNSGQVYDVPDNTPSSNDGRKINESFDNPGYYSTIHEVHSTTDNSQIDAMVSPSLLSLALFEPLTPSTSTVVQQPLRDGNLRANKGTMVQLPFLTVI